MDTYNILDKLHEEVIFLIIDRLSENETMISSIVSHNFYDIINKYKILYRKIDFKFTNLLDKIDHNRLRKSYYSVNLICSLKNCFILYPSKNNDLGLVAETKILAIDNKSLRYSSENLLRFSSNLSSEIETTLTGSARMLVKNNDNIVIYNDNLKFNKISLNDSQIKIEETCNHVNRNSMDRAFTCVDNKIIVLHEYLEESNGAAISIWDQDNIDEPGHYISCAYNHEIVPFGDHCLLLGHRGLSVLNHITKEHRYIEMSGITNIIANKKVSLLKVGFFGDIIKYYIISDLENIKDLEFFEDPLLKMRVSPVESSLNFPLDDYIAMSHFIEGDMLFIIAVNKQICNFNPWQFDVPDYPKVEKSGLFLVYNMKSKETILTRYLNKRPFAADICDKHIFVLLGDYYAYEEQNKKISLLMIDLTNLFFRS